MPAAPFVLVHYHELTGQTDDGDIERILGNVECSPYPNQWPLKRSQCRAAAESAAFISPMEQTSKSRHG